MKGNDQLVNEAGGKALLVERSRRRLFRRQMEASPRSRQVLAGGRSEQKARGRVNEVMLKKSEQIEATRRHEKDDGHRWLDCLTVLGLAWPEITHIVFFCKNEQQQQQRQRQRRPHRHPLAQAYMYIT